MQSIFSQRFGFSLCILIWFYFLTAFSFFISLLHSLNLFVNKFCRAFTFYCVIRTQMLELATKIAENISNELVWDGKVASNYLHGSSSEYFRTEMMKNAMANTQLKTASKVSLVYLIIAFYKRTLNTQMQKLSEQ